MTYSFLQINTQEVKIRTLFILTRQNNVLFVCKVVNDFANFKVDNRERARAHAWARACVRACLSLTSDSSETIKVTIIKFGTVTASDMIMHHVLIILTLTFIQGHTYIILNVLLHTHTYSLGQATAVQQSLLLKLTTTIFFFSLLAEPASTYLSMLFNFSFSHKLLQICLVSAAGSKVHLECRGTWLVSSC